MSITAEHRNSSPNAAVIELARRHSDRIAAGRRLTDEVVRGIQDCGVPRTYLPTALGGSGVPLGVAVDAIVALSAADGSTGWCTCITAASKLFAGYVPEASAREIWVDPDHVDAGVFNPVGTAVRTEGADRYVLDGRWRFASNCLHSDYLNLGAMFRDHADADPEPVPRLVFVPRADVEIHDRWDVVGLHGTGSHEIEVRDLTIDRSWSCSFMDRPWPDEPLWRIPLFTVLMPTLAAAPLGIARSAVDQLVARVADGQHGTRGSLAEDPVAMTDLSRADAALRAARAGLDRAVEATWAQAVAGDPIDQRLQTAVMASSGHAVETLVAAVDTAHRLGGAAAVFADDGLLRALADVTAARQHIAFSRSHGNVFGQALCGREVFAPPFLF